MDGNILGTIRASSWSGLFDCATRWYFHNILGLKMPSSPAATLGTAIHHGTAQYDASILAGNPIAIEEAADASRAALRDPKEETDWSNDEDLTPKVAEDFAVRLTSKYCIDLAPRQRYAAVELECEALDVSTEFGVVRLTGTTDRIRIAEDGRKGIADLKSGKRATEKTEDGGRRAVTSGHHIQLGIYTLMAEQASGEALEAPAQIIGLQTTKEAPVATGEVGDVKRALLGTEEHPGLIVMAAQMLKTGFFPPNPKSWTCSKKFCAGYARCPYHD